MTNSKPNVNPDAHYELRDAAKALGCAKSTVLRYTHQNKLPCGGIKKSNDRMFWLGKDIIKFWLEMY